ncbi:hypothetical protein QTN25_002474 [Entamoeba marina]
MKPLNFEINIASNVVESNFTGYYDSNFDGCYSHPKPKKCGLFSFIENLFSSSSTTQETTINEQKNILIEEEENMEEKESMDERIISDEIQTKDLNYNDLIELQRADGHFINIKSIFNKYEEIKEKYKDVDVDVLDTIIGICLLKSNFKEEKLQWNLLVKKALTVAKGAAIYAKDLSCNDFLKSTIIINHVPHSIGVEIDQGRFLKIIDKNEVVPARGTQILELKPGVKQSTIRIYQGECNYVDAPGMQFVKSFILKNNSQSMTAIRVEITFKYNKNGMVGASAKILNNEVSEVSVTIEVNNIEHDEYIERCRSEIQDMLPDNF